MKLAKAGDHLVVSIGLIDLFRMAENRECSSLAYSLKGGCLVASS